MSIARPVVKEPSPEVKAMIRSFVAAQREKHGENWKEIVAAEMAAKAAPFVEALLELRDRARK